MMMSSEPKCVAMSSMTDTIAFGSATSSAQDFALPPDEVIASATARVPSAVKSVTATLAPSSAKTCAVARPMPLAAPVTTTVRPFTERASFLISAMEYSRDGKWCCVQVDKAGTDPQTGQTRQEQGATVANIPLLQIRRLEASDSAGYRDIRL